MTKSFANLLRGGLKSKCRENRAIENKTKYLKK